VTVASEEPARGFDRGAPLRLHPDVAVRDEAFGALAYHYGNRRLVFLKSRELVDIVMDLDAHQSAQEAVRAHVADGEIDRYCEALAALVVSGVLSGR
jgi:putative mycofactocin binding protein MftB